MIIQEANKVGEGLVTFEGVSKTYPDGTVGIEHLDLTCPSSGITVFVGPSGCGKTTSLRLINRMLKPSAGTIRIDGVDVASMDESVMRRQMGYVIQNAGLFPHRKIHDNIATVPKLLGVRKRKARERALELMEMVGLNQSLAARYPYQLSGGQQQRVGVARALAADPPVLLMDEPFSAVDPVVRGELQAELLRLQQDLGKTIVFVTHDMDEAVRLGDKIVVFQEGGTVAQIATPDELLIHPANQFVDNFLGRDSGIKWLTLIETGSLLPNTGQVVYTYESEPDLSRWRLYVKPDGKDATWVAPGEKTPDAELSCRRKFVYGVDSLRVALDSALLSPSGQAVACREDGTVLGLIELSQLEEQIDLSRGRVHVA